MSYCEDLNLRDIEYLDLDGLLQTEKWVTPYRYFDKYQISDLGRIKSLNFNNEKRQGIIKQSLSNKGYYHVRLKNIHRKFMNIHTHQMVAVGFLDHVIGELNKIIDHKNDIKSDNRAVNLQIVTPRFNNNKNKIKDGNIFSESWYKSENDWRPIITINKIIYKLGSYINSRLASEAYNKALHDWESIGKSPLILKTVKNNESRGVRYIEKGDKWSARLTYKSKKYHVGYFKTKKEAIEARDIVESDIETFVESFLKKKRSVMYHSKSSKWLVCLNINKKPIVFGRFDLKEEAEQFNAKISHIYKTLVKEERTLKNMLLIMLSANMAIIKSHAKYLKNN